MGEDWVDRALHEAPTDDTPDAEAMRRRLANRMFGKSNGPVRMGRYEVVSALGAGGMGQVHLADDPELDRQVALKILHDHVADDPRHRARIIREARALAKLSHPNVVALYDVFEHQEKIVLAMEHVEGCSLQEWQTSKPRPWKDVLEVYGEAARGLAAAHRAGIVHRDFKPTNALRGDDGRVRVLDFGVAGGPAVVGETPLELPGREPPTHDGPTPMSAALGTPGYMAPEQWAGRHVDGLADQFALCLALWEALTGVRPFGIVPLTAPEDVAEPRGEARGVPSPVWRALRQGLRFNPMRRWPDLDTLADELAYIPGRHRRRLYGLGGVLVAASAVAAVRSIIPMPPEPEDCTGDEAAIDEFWTDEARNAIGSAAGAGPEFASNTWERLEADLGDYALAWSETSRNACALSPSRRDAARQCLERRLGQFEFVVGALAGGGVGALGRAPALRATLLPLSDCEAGGPVARDGSVPADDRHGAQREALERLFDDAHVSVAVARFDEAGPKTERLLEALDAAEVTTGRLLAEAKMLRGTFLREVGRPHEAEALLDAAMRLALTSDDDDTALRAVAQLARVQAADLGHPQQGLGALNAMKGVLDRNRASPTTGRAVGRARAVVLLELGELDAARSQLERIAPQARGVQRLRIDLALAEVAQANDEPERARALLDAAIEAAGAELGPDHPVVGMAYRDRGVLRQQAEPETAAEDLRRAYEIGSTAYPEGTLRWAQNELVRAMQLRERGEWAAVRRHADAAWAVQETALPRGHYERGAAQHLLGQAAQAEGKLQEYVAHERAVWREYTAGSSNDEGRLEVANNLWGGYDEIGDDEQARPWVQHVAELAAPGSKNRVDALAWLYEYEKSRGYDDKALRALRAVQEEVEAHSEADLRDGVLDWITQERDRLD